MTRILAALLLLLPMLAGCGDDPAGPQTRHIGSYELHSVNGNDVPVSFEEDGGTVTIVAATLTLNANGTFSMTAEITFTEGGQTTTETDSLTGTYTISGNSVTFAHGGEDEGFETATISGDILTTAGGDGSVLVFEKG